MIDKAKVNDELGRRFGPSATFHEPSRRDRFALWFRSFLHPLGIHHGVRTFHWDPRLDRLIDEGRVCRVCGLPCH